MAELDQARIAHLEMIQSVIRRMATITIVLKALAVALTAGVLAFAGAAPDPTALVVLAALVPVLMLWVLDARYLRLERLFRRLYDTVRRGAAAEPFTMDVTRFEADEASSLASAASWSVSWVYGAIAIVLIVALATVAG